MCCHQKTQLGKLDDNTDVLDLWRNSVAQEIRAETFKGNLHPVCSSWNACPFIMKEKTRHPQEMYRGAAYPLYLEICLPDKHCNVGGENPNEDNPACIMCRRNFDIPSQPDITEFLCEKSISLMPYLKYFCVLGIAEPFWKDAVFKIFDRLNFDDHKDHIMFYTHTNGITMRDELARKFLNRTRMSELCWSLDSATPETFRKIRRMDVFDTVCANLKNFVELKREYESSTECYHKVNIYNNINLLNVHEMNEMVELAHDLGVDKIMMTPTTDQLGVVELGELILNKKNVSIFKKAAEKAQKRADDLKVDFQLVKRFDVVAPDAKKTVKDSLVQLTLPN